MELGVYHCGFVIPFYVTVTQGRHWRRPQRGVCSECGEHRDRVYILGDGATYCDHCIEFDLAEAFPDTAIIQNHPALVPDEANTGAHRVPPAFIEAFA